MAKKPKTLPGRVFAQFGSIWLTVVLLTNLFLLTWLGTLEQVEKGIHQVQAEYFESWWVLAQAGPLKVILPGGYLTMGLFTVNLIVGGLIRIRKSKATIGVIIGHVGIALMMIGGLVEHATSDYGRIVLHTGEEGGEFQEFEGWEVAIWDADATSGVQEYIIPGAHFTDLDGADVRTFERADLPFDLVLSRFMENCTPKRTAGAGMPDAPDIEGMFLARQRKDPENERNIAGLYVKAISNNSGALTESFLFGIEQYPWVFESGGKNWAVELRHTVHAMPFRLRLVKFTKDDHPGMSMARAYFSDVIRVDADGVEHSHRIEMNDPLREGGLIVYQSGFGPQDGGIGEPYTVLAVSKNPSDRIPLYSVILIAVGLLWTFSARLLGFLGKERRRALKSASQSTSADAGAKAA